MRGQTALETLVNAVETSLANVAEHASVAGLPHPDRLKRHAWAMRAYMTIQKPWGKAEAAAGKSLHKARRGALLGGQGEGERGEREDPCSPSSPCASPSSLDVPDLPCMEEEDFITDTEDTEDTEEAEEEAVRDRRTRRDISLLGRGLLPKSHQGLWAISLEDLCPLPAFVAMFASTKEGTGGASAGGGGGAEAKPKPPVIGLLQPLLLGGEWASVVVSAMRHLRLDGDRFQEILTAWLPIVPPRSLAPCLGHAISTCTAGGILSAQGPDPGGIMREWCLHTVHVSHARVLSEACRGFGPVFEELAGKLRDLEVVKRYLDKIPGSEARGTLTLAEVNASSMARVLAGAQLAFRKLQAEEKEAVEAASLRAESKARRDAAEGEEGAQQAEEEEEDAGIAGGGAGSVFVGEEALGEAAMALSEVLEEFRRCTTSDMLTGHRASIAIEAWGGDPTRTEEPGTATDHLEKALDEACSVESPGWRLGVLLLIWIDHLSPWLATWLLQAETETETERERGGEGGGHREASIGPPCSLQEVPAGVFTQVLRCLACLSREDPLAGPGGLDAAMGGIEVGGIWHPRADPLVVAVQRSLRKGKPSDWQVAAHEGVVHALRIVSRARRGQGGGIGTLRLRHPAPKGARFEHDAHEEAPAGDDPRWLEFAASATEVDPVGSEVTVSSLCLDIDAVRRHLALSLYLRSEDRLADHIADFVKDRRALGKDQLAVARERMCIIFTKMRSTPHKALLGNIPGDIYRWALKVTDEPGAERGVDAERPLALSSTFRLLHQASQVLQPPGDAEDQVWASKAANAVKLLIQRAKAMQPPAAPRGSVQLNQ